MELQTRAVDRLLDALSPALAAELERILAEARQSLEAEFEIRLAAAVRDGEAAARTAAQAQFDTELLTAVEQNSAKVRAEMTEKLQAEFQKTLSEHTQRLRGESAAALQDAANGWHIEREALQKQLEQWRVFADSQRQLMEAESQPEILVRWMKLAEPFASSVALYTAKADGLALWKSRGPAVFPDIISQQSADPESFFKQVVVRGKTVAAVCAHQPYRPEALEFLIATMERAIELFGLKLRAPAIK